MPGSVPRSVYSHWRAEWCTLFAHRAGRRCTVVVRIAAVPDASHAGAVGKRL